MELDCIASELFRRAFLAVDQCNWEGLWHELKKTGDDKNNRLIVALGMVVQMTVHIGVGSPTVGDSIVATRQYVDKIPDSLMSTSDLILSKMFRVGGDSADHTLFKARLASGVILSTFIEMRKSGEVSDKEVWGFDVNVPEIGGLN